MIGGYGGMGQIFARLFKEEKFNVVITGPTKKKGQTVAEELGVSYTSDNKEAIKGADVVVITVPIEMTLDVIQEVAPCVETGSLLMDLTSVKEEPCKAMKEFSKSGVEVIGAHPIFGPRVNAVDGQVLVLVPVRGKNWLPKIKKILGKHKCRIFETTPKEHDKTMAVVQGLTHFSYISFGKTLQELNFDIKASRNLSSPIYELMLDMVGRIIGQDPTLYAQIQIRNPYVAQVHKRFLETAQKLGKAVAEKDEKQFIQMMVDSAKHFDDVERAMGRSDKVISAQISELKELKDSIGEEICLEHIYSGKKHVGTVKDVTSNEVILKSGGKTFELRLSNVRILDDEERVNFKIEKFGTLQRDFSIVLGKGVDEGFIAKLLKEHDETIVHIKVKDRYSGPQIEKGAKSICFGVEFINIAPKEKESQIIDFFVNIGGKLR